MKKLYLFLVVAAILMVEHTHAKERKNNNKKKVSHKQQSKQNLKLSNAYFGGGCFWCVQAMFEQLKGVYDVESGYSGGFIQNPQYKQVKKGLTGHAEVIKIQYDPSILSFKQLFYIFMHAHDPTTYHKQGIDSGSQYRSVVFYQTQEQLKTIKTILNEIQKDQSYTGAPAMILTEVAMFTKYYPAQKYHQDYFSINPFDQECSAIIAPKVAKMRKLFKSYYKDSKEEL